MTFVLYICLFILTGIVVLFIEKANYEQTTKYINTR